jgi:hypothetical protein
MTSPPSLPPNTTRVRIHSHLTQSRFLHVEDALAIGKLRLFAGNYRPHSRGPHGRGLNGATGGGMTDHVTHYLDLADARVVGHALLQAEANFSYKEYKGTPPQGQNGAVSRVLAVTVKGESVYIELKSGPGQLTATGAIMPDGPATAVVNVGLKLYEARRLAAAVLAYLQAWDVLRILAHKEAVSPPAAYALTPTAAIDGDPVAGGHPTESPAAEASPPANANGRPVTRPGPAVTPSAVRVPAGPNCSRRPRPQRVRHCPPESDRPVSAFTHGRGPGSLRHHRRRPYPTARAALLRRRDGRERRQRDRSPHLPPLSGGAPGRCPFANGPTGLSPAEPIAGAVARHHGPLPAG